MFWRFPDKRPTPQEWAVIAWAAMVVFVVGGVATLCAAFRAGPELAETLGLWWRAIAWFVLTGAVFALMVFFRRLLG